MINNTLYEQMNRIRDLINMPSQTTCFDAGYFHVEYAL